MNRDKQHRSVLIIALACAAGAATPVWGYDVWYVDADATGASNGTSWTNAFPFLQDALAAADPGDEVWVAEGTYKPTDRTCTSNADCTAIADGACVSGTCQWDYPRTASFHLKDVRVYGGFDGWETQRSQRDLDCKDAILTGDIQGNDGADFANRADNSCHVVWVDAEALADRPGLPGDLHGTRLDGFTVRGGHAKSEGGDGLCMEDLAPVTWGGAGIAMKDSGASIWNCVITDNLTDGFGAGVLIGDTVPLGHRKDIVRCAIVGNRASNFGSGGGVHQEWDGDLNIFNCIVADNEGGDLPGAGMSLISAGGGIRIVNTLVARNRPSGEFTSNGAGVFIGAGGGVAKISNSTIVDNGKAGVGRGNGILVDKAAVQVENSIIWGNNGDTATAAGRQIRVLTPTNPPGIVFVEWSNVLRVGIGGDRTVDVSPTSRVYFKDGSPNDLCPSPNTWANLGCDIADAPLFRDPTGLDYGLTRSGSTGLPPIDSANDEFVQLDIVDLDEDGNYDQEKIPVDLVENTRIVDDPVVDDCVQAPDPDSDCDQDAENELPIVDMGAYELPPCDVAANCNDIDWCTVDSCSDSNCVNTCIERLFGDVNHSGIVNMDDILAVLSCISGSGAGCSNCGPNQSGTASGCDIADAAICPSYCGSDGYVNLQDILAVMGAFSDPNYCPACCSGEQDGMGEGVGNLGVAEAVIGYLASTETIDSASEELHRLLATSFITFAGADFTDAERAAVVELIASTEADAVDELAKELLDDVCEGLSE